MSQHAMRPYVQVAVICHLALVDTTGKISLIQIVDRIPVAGPTDDMPPQSLSQFFLAVILKSGDMKGQYRLKIVAETPSGKRIPGSEVSVLFEGDERGVATLSPIGIVAMEPGLYWFDVMVEDDVLTRIPLRLMYQKAQFLGIAPHLPEAG